MMAESGPVRMPEAIVDAHHHLWDLSRFPYPWLAPDAPPRRFGDHGAIKRDYLPADYRKHFEGLPLVATVHVQANCGAEDDSEETAWLADLAAATGLPDAAVGAVDLSSERAAEVLAAHARYPLIRGVRALVAHDRDGHWRFANRPHVLSEAAFRRNAGVLAELDLGLDLVVVPEQLGEVAYLARDLPKLSIIVDHLGTPEPHNRTEWEEGIAALAPCENVSLKLSGLWPLDKGWSAEALRPFVHHALRQVGRDRLMYGSNAPIETLHCPIATQVKTLVRLVGELDPFAVDPLFHRNASRLYRLACPS